MTDVELRHLAALAAIAEEGSFGRAASRLGYTQSTVSQQIAALERSVGGAVFDRPGGPRPVRITPLGAVVLAEGRELLAKADALSNAVDRFKAGDGRIDIGTFQSVSSVILPSVIRRLRDEHPGCDIRLSEEEPDQPQIGDLDLLFYDGIVDGDLEHVELLDDPTSWSPPPAPSRKAPSRFSSSTTHPWSPGPHVRPAPHGAVPRSRRSPPPGRFPQRGQRHPSSMVRAGLGSAILPHLAIQAANIQVDPALAIHELTPAPPPRSIHLHWPAARTPLPPGPPRDRHRRGGSAHPVTPTSDSGHPARLKPKCRHSGGMRTLRPESHPTPRVNAPPGPELPCYAGWAGRQRLTCEL